jgi:hypothetical protein
MAGSRGLVANLGLLVSGGFDVWSPKGIIPGNLGADASARLRWGFTAMSTKGPVEAVNRDFGGMVGGLFALAIGNVGRLVKGMRNFQVSVQYVYEKVQHGEVGPHTGFPMRESLGRCATTIIENYPEAFVRALESGGWRAVMPAFLREPGRVTMLFVRYPVFTFLVLYSVAVFMTKAMFDSSDAPKYALCELAIMESELAGEAKDGALDELRKTAPRTIIEYEYYVPLLVPFDGGIADKVCRRNASGQPIETHSVIPSVFKLEAIQIAQSLVSEVITLRSFLWLYGSEPVAREKTHRETARKFGPEAADRIAAHPLYPLRPEEIAQLIESGPRAPAAVAAILDGLLRERGLDGVDGVAHRIAAGRPQPA